MNLKWIGALLTLISCGSCGFLAAYAHRRQEESLFQLMGVLTNMAWELEYQLTPLPDLCEKAAGVSIGAIGNFFKQLSRELNGQASPNVAGCISIVLKKCDGIPKLTEKALKLLGESLGRYDCAGQLKGLESVREYCRQKLAELGYRREERLRSYRVLGICAGAALAILLI